MSEILCIECGQVGRPQLGKCAHCGSATVIPADSPIARKFIDERAARRDAEAASGRGSIRAAATGRVLGRTLGKLFRK